jgi:hypothetical protein
MTYHRHPATTRVGALILALAVTATACGRGQTEHTSATDTLTASHRVQDTAVVKKDVTVKTDTLKKTDHAKDATKP